MLRQVKMAREAGITGWSGTWLFGTKNLASATKTYGSKLIIVATEKQPDDCKLIARPFRGHPYYWSSADPRHTYWYSENSQIEPGLRYRNTSPRVVVVFEHTKAPLVRNFN